METVEIPVCAGTSGDRRTTPAAVARHHRLRLVAIAVPRFADDRRCSRADPGGNHRHHGDGADGDAQSGPGFDRLGSFSITLVAITLVVTVLPRVLLWLTAAGNKCRQATYILPAFVCALVRMMRLRLMLLAIVYLLVARRKWLSVAGEIRLLLRFARRVARFVLAHEGLAVVVVTVETFVASLLVLPARHALLRLLIVVGVLLTKLFLRGRNKTKIMFGVLVVVLGGNWIAGALGVARKLNIFFCNVRSSAANFDIRAV